MSFFTGEILFSSLDTSQDKVLTPGQVDQFEEYRQSLENCHWTLNPSKSGFTWNGITPFPEYARSFHQLTVFLRKTLKVGLRGKIQVEDEMGHPIHTVRSDESDWDAKPSDRKFEWDELMQPSETDERVGMIPSGQYTPVDPERVSTLIIDESHFLGTLYTRPFDPVRSDFIRNSIDGDIDVPPNNQSFQDMGMPELEDASTSRETSGNLVLQGQRFAFMEEPGHEDQFDMTRIITSSGGDSFMLESDYDMPELEDDPISRSHADLIYGSEPSNYFPFNETTSRNVDDNPPFDEAELVFPKIPTMQTEESQENRITTAILHQTITSLVEEIIKLGFWRDSPRRRNFLSSPWYLPSIDQTSGRIYRSSELLIDRQPHIHVDDMLTMPDPSFFTWNRNPGHSIFSSADFRMDEPRYRMGLRSLSFDEIYQDLRRPRHRDAILELSSQQEIIVRALFENIRRLVGQ